MAYTINHYAGGTITVLNDGVTDNTNTSLTLIGKNFAGYGQFLNENLVYMLENFAGSSSPTAPLVGQIWWNSLANALQVWTGSTWKGISSTTAAPTYPTIGNIGDLWWDTTNQQLNVLKALPATTAGNWTIIGPQYSTGLGLTGAIPSTIVDLSSVSHTVIKLVVGNTLMGIISTDPTFNISGTIDGVLFPTTIAPGLTLSTYVVANYKFIGNVTNADNLGLQPATNYVRSDAGATPQTMGQSLSIQNNTGLNIGTTNDLQVYVSGGNVNLAAGAGSTKNTVFSVNVGVTPTVELTLDATTGHATVPNITINSPGTSIVNKNYADNTGFNLLDFVTPAHLNELVSTRTGTITGPNTTPVVIATVSSTYRSAEFLVQATTASSYQLSKILATQDGSIAYFTEYGSVNSGNVIATYSVTAPSGSLILTGTPTVTATTFKVTTIAVST